MTTGRYVALDFETSGYAAHSACAVGLCRIEDGVVTDSFYSLIRPLTGVDIVINLETGAVIYMGTILTISISLDLAVSIGTGAYCLCL